MKVATYNVNGVNGRLDVLPRWLAEAAPDVVVLQELRAPDATLILKTSRVRLSSNSRPPRQRFHHSSEGGSLGCAHYPHWTLYLNRYFVAQSDSTAQFGL